MESESTFKIVEPCHENWNQMTAESQGRFCASCQRCVIDFSTKSKTEMKAIYEKEGGDVCGRVKISQLVTSRPPIRAQFNVRRHGLKSLQLFALALLAAFTLMVHSPAKAQKDVVMGKIAYVPPTTGSLEGKVTWDSREAASGVTVELRLNGQLIASTVTNVHGRYSFDGQLLGAYTVSAKAGHGAEASKTIDIKDDRARELNLVLMDRVIMGGISFEENRKLEPVEVRKKEPMRELTPLIERIEIPASEEKIEIAAAENDQILRLGGFQILVFPNPTSDFISVLVEKAGKQVLTATLFDLDGRLMGSVKFEGTEVSAQRIDMKALPAGIYLLDLQVGEDHTARRILKL
jgi:hypothetical protein